MAVVLVRYHCSLRGVSLVAVQGGGRVTIPFQHQGVAHPDYDFASYPGGGVMGLAPSIPPGYADPMEVERMSRRVFVGGVPETVRHEARWRSLTPRDL